MERTQKVVFIIGTGHCGSTLLDLILGSHSDGFSLAEFHVITRFLSQADPDTREICSLCVQDCRFWNHTVSLPRLAAFYAQGTPYRSMRRRAFRMFRNPYADLFEWSGSGLLIDSSKSPGWFASQLTPHHTWRQVQPYLLYLERDGRAVTNSYLRKYPERGIVDISEDWRRRVTSLDRFFHEFAFPHKMRVSYERLATDPERVTQSICEFLGISFEERMLAYWLHDHHPISGNAGTHSLVLRQREKVSAQAAEFRERVNQGDRYYQSEHYTQVGLAIRLDERWRREMSRQNQEVFEQIAGDVNRAILHRSQAD